MSDLISLIAKFGWLPVLLGVAIYIILRGRVQFPLPAKVNVASVSSFQAGGESGRGLSLAM
jgi:hypothetical protein